MIKRNRENKQKMKNKMADVSFNISIFTLNVSCPNTLIKKQKLTERIETNGILLTRNKYNDI